jgi:hypothetical protein
VTATVWDANNKSSTEALSGGNLVATSSGVGTVAASRTLTGKTYFEITPTTLTGTVAVGLVNRSYNMASGNILGTDNNGIGYKSSGAVVLNNVTLTTIATYVQGNVIGVAVDIENRLIWFRVGTGNWNNSGTANPATGVGGIDYSSMALTSLFPAAGGSATGAVMTAAFSTFTNTAPSGFVTTDTCQATAVNADFGAGRGSLSPASPILVARSTFQMGRGASTSGLVVPVAAVLPPATIGTSYSETISVQGGSPPYTFSVTGSMPPGLSLNASTGVISGTATTIGGYSFTIRVADANSLVGSEIFSIAVTAAASAVGNYGWAA